MTEQRALLEEIARNYEEDLPRLIYADWLEEQGDPRAEFIRIQCEVDRYCRQDPRRKVLQSREYVLLQDHAAEWLSPLQTLGYRDRRFRRGFLNEVTISLERFLREGERLFEDVPEVQGIWMRQAQGRLSHLADCAALQKICSLNLSLNFLRPRDLEVLLDTPPPRLLKSLSLGTNILLPEGATVLSRSPWMQQLTSLDLVNTSIRTMGLMALAEALKSPGLRELRIGGIGIGSEGIKMLADSQVFSHLEVLNLSHNRLGSSDVQTLVNSSNFSQVRYLDLSSNEIDESGLITLTESTGFPELDTLHVGDQYFELTDRAAHAFAVSQAFPRLQCLNFGPSSATLSYPGIPDRSYPRLSTKTRKALRTRFGNGVLIRSQTVQE